jgi:hypothetical protein
VSFLHGLLASVRILPSGAAYVAWIGYDRHRAPTAETNRTFTGRVVKLEPGRVTVLIERGGREEHITASYGVRPVEGTKS